MQPIQGQISVFDLVSPFGRTYPELSTPIKAKTSKPSLKRSQACVREDYQFLNLRSGAMPEAWLEVDGALHGAPTMLNTGECPSVARESTLSQILEANVPEKYYLSAKACQGILRRAQTRGKTLPPMLKEALEEAVSLSKNAQGSQGGGKGILAGTDLTFTLQTNTDQSIAYGVDAYNQALIPNKSQPLRSAASDIDHAGGVLYRQTSFAGYEQGTGTLRASGGDNGGGLKALWSVENHPNDSRVKITGNTVQTLSSRMGTGGGNVPLILGEYDE